jgi:hypothetical protein
MVRNGFHWRRIRNRSWDFVKTAVNFRVIIIIISIIIGVGLSPLGTAATSGLLYKPQMIDEGDYGAIGGMKGVDIIILSAHVVRRSYDSMPCHS